MSVAAMTIDARRLWAGEQVLQQPLAFIDLDTAAEWPDALVLPPCPVVGLGSRDHPLAGLLDAVIEPPVTSETVMRQVLAMPNAAAVSVQLLRLIEAMLIQQALTAESLAYGLLQGSDEHRAWLANRARPDEPGASGAIDALRSGALLTITLDRPAAGNAIDRAMRDELHAAFSAAALDPGIECLVLNARGRSFSLGADLAEFGTTRDPATAHGIRLASLPAWQIAACADRLHAHLQGACVGAGLEMAAWARRISAKPDAWFQLPELAMGILPGAGGCVSLSRRIGRQRTALMLLSGKRIPARVALDWGLIDAITDHFTADHGEADIG